MKRMSWRLDPGRYPSAYSASPPSGPSMSDGIRAARIKAWVRQYKVVYTLGRRGSAVGMLTMGSAPVPMTFLHINSRGGYHGR